MEKDKVPVVILDDANGPIQIPDLEPPFSIYPIKSQDAVMLQGYIRVSDGGRYMAVHIPLSDDDAMELLGALDAYRKQKGISPPSGDFLRQQ